MFKEISVINYNKISDTNTLKIIDDNFQEVIAINNYRLLYKQNYILSNCRSDAEAMVIVYEAKILNVAANIAILLNKYYMEDIGWFYSKIYEESKILLPYKQDIEKYLLLL